MTTELRQLGLEDGAHACADGHLRRLRETQWGGPVWSAADAERVLRAIGFVHVRALPNPPAALVTWVVGRRETA